jgi:hypothetical protein
MTTTRWHSLVNDESSLCGNHNQQYDESSLCGNHNQQCNSHLNTAGNDIGKV